MNDDCRQESNETLLSILKITEGLNRYQDIYTILDAILLAARQFANSDAGSIFLKEEKTLKFSYVQNDTLFKSGQPEENIYANFSVPINEQSIVGYVAMTKNTLAIDDAYQMAGDLPYTFNPSYDEKTGYKTRSILTIPLITFQNRLVGVMQIINARDPFGKPSRFSRENQTYASLLANYASVAIERGMMNRELILRMMKTAQLRDPAETGAHVQRVGAYAAEIYQKWALNHSVGKEDIIRKKDLIRLAAMLHDVGKVGVSDIILKKPAKLTLQEFNIMKRHTIYGARLFVNQITDLDRMSFNITLNHHEKWNGDGYPGKLDDLLLEQPQRNAPKKGLEIPLSARITAVADVFDALATRRSYKEPWPEDRILETIKKESAIHFDPEVVDAFFQIYPVIKAIQAKYC
jgi:HD-GYP domain-containing protein (c-di-GMP phosphodiesterase class II)